MHTFARQVNQRPLGERSSWRRKRRRDERSEGGIGEEEATFQIFASLKRLDWGVEVVSFVMFVTWQSKHRHDSTEFTIIMANHNFATEVIDLRKIKAQPMTAVGEAAQSIIAQRFGQNKASRASRNEE
jgi:hypothetical protein